MFCEKCGSPIGPNEKFCKNCGQVFMPSSMSSNVQTSYAGMNMMNNGSNLVENGVNPNPNSQMNDMNQQNAYTPNNSLNNMNQQNAYTPNNQMNNMNQQNAYTPNNSLNNMNQQNAYTPNDSLNNMNQQNAYTPNNGQINSYPSNNMPMNSYIPSGNKPGLSKGAVGAIVAIFVVAIICAFCIIALPKIMNKNDNSDSSSTVDSGDKINYQNFSFSIPSDLNTGYENEVLYIYNDQWTSYLSISAGDFSRIKSNVTLIKSKIQQEGYNVEKTDVATYNGVEFVNFYVLLNGEQAVFAYAKLNSNYCICFVIVDDTLKYDSDLFNTLATIIRSAKYSPSSNGLKASASKIDYTKAFELVK